MDTLFQIAVLIMSVVVHEVSHGYSARALGDRTAEYQGRLTLNPIHHLDIWGSIIVPVLLAISSPNFIIGWAKPVPINPYNFRNQKWGEAIVAFSGPASNLGLALIFGLAIRFGLVSSGALKIVGVIVVINLVLAIFNLIPIPPMDGSKILFAFLPASLIDWRAKLERYGFIFALVFVIFFWKFVSPIVEWLFGLIVG